MKLILIAGKARSGKTLAAKILKEELEKNGKRVVITEYSKYIKLFARELTDWDGFSEPKPRKFLQDFGSYVRHKTNNPKYFIERMKEDLEIYQEFCDVVIISDVRLEEEILEMKKYSPITIHIENRYNLYDLNQEEQGHETEHALDNFQNFDYSIKDKSESEMKSILISIGKKENLL